MIAVNIQGGMFLGAGVFSGLEKTERTGLQIISVVTDNTNNCVAAGKRYRRYMGIFFCHLLTLCMSYIELDVKKVCP